MLYQKKRIKLTMGILVAFAAFFAGIFIAQHVTYKKTMDESQLNGTLLHSARPVAAFDLQGIDTKPFDNASLKGQWTLLFFGFTQCGSVCPITMAELGKMYRLLEAQHSKILPHVVMITLDPERDSLLKLKHYVKAFDKNFYGARGNATQVKAMAREMGIAYAKIIHNDNYDIEHTGTVMLINPKGQLLAFFTTPHKATALARDFSLLVS